MKGEFNILFYLPVNNPETGKPVEAAVKGEFISYRREEFIGYINEALDALEEHAQAKIDAAQLDQP